jgi:predicted ATPase
VVTFLFTDVEGSTRRWEADADEMRLALAAHDEVLRGAIGAHGGFMFKHTGDGVCAAFSSPRAAVDAAVAAQRALELPVRMGIATGEAELRDGDYFGTVLNRAARVMAAGHGGQILVADSTASLVSGVDLIDLGPRRLRDVPMPVGVFQVRASGLRTEFPKLRALDPTPGNLKPPITNLIGRESDVAEIEAAVRSCRLVTLTGVGGVGKTRLAFEVAARLADEFPDGVWVFELAAVADPAAVADAVAAVLGITQQPGKTVSESVAAALEGRTRLLVFDNCEHVVDAAADQVEAILAASATVKVMATSREGLGVIQEQVWPVRPLDSASAVDLFVEHAYRVAPNLSVVDVGPVGEICRRLDGIPLAIELAASRISSMAVNEIRDRLDHRFKLLVGSRRGLGRHQTLRHAVAWSYDLLDDAEKVLLERCSVFAGGFDLEDARAVAEFDQADDYQILDLLDALVRKSLLVADRSSGRTRFSMLETVREFADEHLVAHDDAAAARTAHARHFAACEADILALWDSPRQKDAYEWLTVELANLRVAFRWAADQGDLDAAAAIATYAPFLLIGLDNYETIGWAEELIEPARSCGHPRLGVLYVMASQCWMPGRIDDAVRYCEAAQAAIDMGNGMLPHGVMGYFGAPYLAIGEPERMIDACRRELESGHDRNLALTAGCYVLALNMAGRDEESRAATSGLIDSAEATQNPYVLSFALLARGVAFFSSDPAQALEDFQRGLSVARESGNHANETHLANMVSRVEGFYGDPLAALDYLTVGIRRYHDSGNTTTIRNPLATLAALLDQVGRYEPAATIAGGALSPLTAPGFPQISTAISHLRSVLGEQTYESLARRGGEMSIAALVAYAHDQIDEARTELERPS